MFSDLDKHALDQMEALIVRTKNAQPVVEASFEPEVTGTYETNPTDELHKPEVGMVETDVDTIPVKAGDDIREPSDDDDEWTKIEKGDIESEGVVEQSIVKIDSVNVKHEIPMDNVVVEDEITGEKLRSDSSSSNGSSDDDWTDVKEEEIEEAKQAEVKSVDEGQVKDISNKDDSSSSGNESFESIESPDKSDDKDLKGLEDAKAESVVSPTDISTEDETLEHTEETVEDTISAGLIKDKDTIPIDNEELLYGTSLPTCPVTITITDMDSISEMQLESNQTLATEEERFAYHEDNKVKKKVTFAETVVDNEKVASSSSESESESSSDSDSESENEGSYVVDRPRSEQVTDLDAEPCDVTFTSPTMAEGSYHTHDTTTPKQVFENDQFVYEKDFEFVQADDANILITEGKNKNTDSDSSDSSVGITSYDITKDDDDYDTNDQERNIDDIIAVAESDLTADLDDKQKTPKEDTEISVPRKTSKPSESSESDTDNKDDTQPAIERNVDDLITDTVTEKAYPVDIGTYDSEPGMRRVQESVPAEDKDRKSSTSSSSSDELNKPDEKSMSEDTEDTGVENIPSEKVDTDIIAYESEPGQRKVVLPVTDLDSEERDDIKTEKDLKSDESENTDSESSDSSEGITSYDITQSGETYDQETNIDDIIAVTDPNLTAEKEDEQNNLKGDPKTVVPRKISKSSDYGDSDTDNKDDNPPAMETNVDDLVTDSVSEKAFPADIETYDSEPGMRRVLESVPYEDKDRKSSTSSSSSDELNKPDEKSMSEDTEDTGVENIPSEKVDTNIIAYDSEPGQRKMFPSETDIDTGESSEQIIDTKQVVTDEFLISDTQPLTESAPVSNIVEYEHEPGQRKPMKDVESSDVDAVKDVQDVKTKEKDETVVGHETKSSSSSSSSDEDDKETLNDQLSESKIDSSDINLVSYDAEPGLKKERQTSSSSSEDEKETNLDEASETKLDVDDGSNVDLVSYDKKPGQRKERRMSSSSDESDKNERKSPSSSNESERNEDSSKPEKITVDGSYIDLVSYEDEPGQNKKQTLPGSLDDSDRVTQCDNEKPAQSRNDTELLSYDVEPGQRRDRKLSTSSSSSNESEASKKDKDPEALTSLETDLDASIVVDNPDEENPDAKTLGIHETPTNKFGTDAPGKHASGKESSSSESEQSGSETGDSRDRKQTSDVNTDPGVDTNIVEYENEPGQKLKRKFSSSSDSSSDENPDVEVKKDLQAEKSKDMEIEMYESEPGQKRPMQRTSPKPIDKDDEKKALEKPTVIESSLDSYPVRKQPDMGHFEMDVNENISELGYEPQIQDTEQLSYIEPELKKNEDQKEEIENPNVIEIENPNVVDSYPVRKQPEMGSFEMDVNENVSELDYESQIKDTEKLSYIEPELKRKEDQKEEIENPNVIESKVDSYPVRKQPEMVSFEMDVNENVSELDYESQIKDTEKLSYIEPELKRNKISLHSASYEVGKNENILIDHSDERIDYHEGEVIYQSMKPESKTEPTLKDNEHEIERTETFMVVDEPRIHGISKSVKDIIAPVVIETDIDSFIETKIEQSERESSSPVVMETQTSPLSSDDDGKRKHSSRDSSDDEKSPDSDNETTKSVETDLDAVFAAEKVPQSPVPEIKDADESMLYQPVDEQVVPQFESDLDRARPEYVTEQFHSAIPVEGGPEDEGRPDKDEVYCETTLTVVRRVKVKQTYATDRTEKQTTLIEQGLHSKPEPYKIADDGDLDLHPGKRSHSLTESEDNGQEAKRQEFDRREEKQTAPPAMEFIFAHETSLIDQPDSVQEQYVRIPPYFPDPKSKKSNSDSSDSDSDGAGI